MKARMIDANRLLKMMAYWKPYIEMDKVRNAIQKMPTITLQNEWVSVEERLPEPEFAGQQRGFYLVALSNGVVRELAYEFRHYENMMFEVGWHETAFPVTHWMLLPSPPDRRPPEGEVDGK